MTKILKLIFLWKITLWKNALKVILCISGQSSWWVAKWHLGIHKVDNIKVVFKNCYIKIILYKKPKKDPRSKLHIRSKNQAKNLDFILDSLSKFYFKVCKMRNYRPAAISFKELERIFCIKCGKYFTNKKRIKTAYNKNAQ